MAKKVYYTVGGGCVLCMTCLYQCPRHAISMIANETCVIDPEKCVGCGRCADQCQSEAIIRVDEA